MVKMLRDDGGQGMLEYSLVIALLSVLCILSVQIMGKKACNSLSNAAAYMS